MQGQSQYFRFDKTIGIVGLGPKDKALPRNTWGPSVFEVDSLLLFPLRTCFFLPLSSDADPGALLQALLQKPADFSGSPCLRSLVPEIQHQKLYGDSRIISTDRPSANVHDNPPVPPPLRALHESLQVSIET